MKGAVHEDQYTLLIMYHSVLLRMKGALHEDQYTLLIMYHSVLLRMKGALHEDQYTLLIMYYSVLLIMKPVTHNSYKETRNTRFISSKFFLIRAVYEICDKMI
jgi:hypothetical protein